MIRQLRCRKCGPLALSADDLDKGWKGRNVLVSVNRIDHLFVCDGCADPVQGLIVWACTQWQGPDHPQPENWEEKFGTVIPLQAAHLADTLAGKRWPISQPRCYRVAASAKARKQQTE